MTALIALAVVTSVHGVLLVQRRDRTPPWSFPGGAVEPGETAEQAAERETLEETGLPDRALRVIGHRCHPTTGRELVYVAAQPAADAEVRTTDPAITAIRWVTVDEIRALLPDMYGPVAAYLGIARR